MKQEKLALDVYPDPESKNGSRTIRFDGTLNTGHILTILTIIICSIGAWYDVKSTVATQQVIIATNALTVEKNNKESIDRDAIISSTIASNQKDNHQEIIQLRTDMNSWFMRLDEKLDKKADKKGM